MLMMKDDCKIESAKTGEDNSCIGYRMVEYLDTIMGVTIELRQLVQKHVSPTNQDYGLILCMFTQIYDLVSSACLEVDLAN